MHRNDTAIRPRTHVVISEGIDEKDTPTREALPFAVDRADVRQRSRPWVAAPDADEVAELVAAAIAAAMRRRAA